MASIISNKRQICLLMALLMVMAGCSSSSKLSKLRKSGPSTPQLSIRPKANCIPEKMGKAQLEFQVIVPQDMLDEKWQLRLHPEISVAGERITLESAVITGAGYRKTQLKDYQQNDRYLSKIVEDGNHLIRVKQLNYFLKRNIPQVYESGAPIDGSEDFMSAFGVSQQQAVKHYTKKHAASKNQEMIRKQSLLSDKLMKSPIADSGICLDTVIINTKGDFIFNYIQSVPLKSEYTKLEVSVSGDIYEQDRKVHQISSSEPVEFNISTLSSFADDTERYTTQVIERKVVQEENAGIVFADGRFDINPGMGNNMDEISKIMGIIGKLANSPAYELDSMTVRATLSPEGPYSRNHNIAQRQSESVASFFRRYLKELGDSIKTAGRNDGFFLEFIPVRPDCIPENWQDLELAVASDKGMDDLDKKMFEKICQDPDMDSRERKLTKAPFYRHLKEELYPRLNMVKFNFHIHRRGMVNDTEQITLPDTIYMHGVQALKNMDYPAALKLLRPYTDVNAAIAYAGMDMLPNALTILESIEKNAKVNYLLAILYARKGDEKKAVDNYLKACSQEKFYVYRGKLEPEILQLINKYGLKDN
ncbi:MAG: hypothetical protein ACI4TM_07070 [Candidatus Cryptobacteroides sp.]